MKKGKLITIEGPEGVGKSTQVRLLTEYCEKIGADVLFVREPGNTVTGERIREVLLKKTLIGVADTGWKGGELILDDGEMSPICEAYLYASCRVELIEKVILPALNSGKTVICDRYIDSSVAYQGYGRGLGAKTVEKINFYAIKKCYPDYTIFLNLSPEEAFSRKGGVDTTDRLELAGAKFHNKVYEGFLAEMDKHQERYISIEPTGDKVDTHEKIVDCLTKILPETFSKAVK